MVRLRAHHLLCILTYSGHGYSSDFVANFDKLIERLKQGEEILLVEGPDEICQPLLVDLFRGPVARHAFAASTRVRQGGITLARGLETSLREDAPHCLQASVYQRDQQAAAVLSDMLACVVAPNVCLSLKSAQFDLMRSAFKQGLSREACVGCEWSDLCTGIACAGFAETKLLAKIDVLPLKGF